MAKIIKKALAPKKTFTIGQIVTWDTYWNDDLIGTIVKICPTNLHIEDTKGNIWSVSKKEAAIVKDVAIVR